MILKQIEDLKEELGKQATRILKRRNALCTGKQYPRLLKLNRKLELLYKELALVDPKLYTRITEANETKSDVVYLIWTAEARGNGAVSPPRSESGAS